MKSRPYSEVMVASNLSSLRGQLAKLQQMLELNHAVVEPTHRERERYTRVLEAQAILRAADALTRVTL